MQRRYGRGRNQFYQHSNDNNKSNRDNNVEESQHHHQNSNNYSSKDYNDRVSNTNLNPGQRPSFSGRQSSSNSVVNYSSGASSTLVQSLSQDNHNLELERPRQVVNKMLDSGSQGDFSSITSNDLATTQRVLALIHKEFKVFECSTCSNNFGYQLKKDPNIKFCTSECLTAGLQKVDDILKGRISQFKSQDGSPLHSPAVLTPSSRMNNGFSELGGGGGGKSPYYQNSTNERNDDGGVKARLLSTLQTGGGISRNGRTSSSTTTNNSNSSDRGGGRLGGPNRPSFNPSDNPFYRGEDRVDRGKAQDEVDFKATGPTQTEIDAAFSKRNLAEEATQKAGFSTIEQKERERILQLARTKNSDIKVETGVSTKTNPLFEKPQLKTISSTTTTTKDQFKPSQVIVPQIIKPQTIQTPSTSSTVLKIIKPQQQQQQENVPPKLKTVEPSKGAVEVTKVATPIQQIWNMKDVLISTSIYDLAECTAAFPWSATKFTISAVADEEKKENLQMELAKHTTAPGMTRIPAIDDIVFAPYDGDYYRGKIVKVNEKSKTASVSFIDFGDACDDIKLSDCKEPTDEIMKSHPIYGVVFSLALKNVEVPEDFELPRDVIGILLEKQITITIESKEKIDDWKGTLYLNDQRSLNHIVQNLIQPKAAPKPAPTTPAPKQPTSNGVPALKTVTKPTPAAVVVKTPTPSTSTSAPSNPTPVAKESPVPKKAPFIVKVGNKPEATKTPPPPVLSKYNVNTIKLSPLLDNEATVQLNFIWDMSRINISAVDDGDNLEKLQTLVNAHTEKAPSLTKNPQVGDIVLAFYVDQYYRGRVTEIKDDGVHVIFLDYGDERTAPLKDIKEPTDEIMAHPIYGVVMKINGLPNTAHDDSNQEILDVLETGGQLQVEEKKDNFTWQGEIWFNEEKNWTTVIESVMKAQGN